MGRICGFCPILIEQKGEIIISNILKLTSPIPVSVNHYLKPRSFIIWKNGKPISQVTMYETATAKKYKKVFIKHIKEQTKLQGWMMSEDKFQKYYVDCTFYFPRIDMDSNNSYKIMLDSITKSECVWIDDTQACERTQGIFYDVEDPRVEIEIRPVCFVGIFPTNEQLQKFKSNCITCKRYRNGRCSIFIKSCEGRIQEEIVDLECIKYKLKNK